MIGLNLNLIQEGHAFVESWLLDHLLIYFRWLHKIHLLLEAIHRDDTKGVLSDPAINQLIHQYAMRV